MKLTITIVVTEEANVGVKTQAADMNEAQIRPSLDRAQRALQAEVDALEQCPYHQRSIQDTDLVCTDCRWRGGHSPDCPRKHEPWPTMDDTDGR